MGDTLELLKEKKKAFSKGILMVSMKGEKRVWAKVEKKVGMMGEKKEKEKVCE